MNTRSILLLSLLAASVASSATAQAPAPVSLRDGGHVRIVSGYLTDEGEATRVRGMVLGDPLHRGPVDGHLVLTAFGPNDEVVARAAVAWSGRITRHGGLRPYQSDLTVPRADIARLSVSWAPGAPKASEASK